MDDDRLPVIVGTGQLRSNRDRTVEGAREPLALLLQALAAAERAAGGPGLLRRADAVHAVHIASWAYDGLAAQVGAAVGADPRTCVDTGIGGHHPVRLLDAAAARIAAGDSDVALIVGAEAQASVSLLGKAGVDPVADLGWSATPGGPPSFDLDQLGSAAMQAAQLIAPTRVYPLFENRLQADLGLTPLQGAQWSGQVYAELSRIAADHLAAWNQQVLTEQQVREVGPGNRMVCEPYPLSMNAMPHVDQAAAVVLTSLGTARELGIGSAVYVWGGAGVDDVPDVLLRDGFGSSRALGWALDRCLGRAGVEIGQVGLLDVYSCFPVVPKLVGEHLGLPRDRALSVTGGHSSFGGPLSSYSLHALATMAGRVRAGERLGLVHANGGYLTHQHAVLLSRRPHPSGYVGEPEPEMLVGRGAPTLTTAAARAVDGTVDVIVETATVEHDRAGTPRQAFVVARTADGCRLAAATPDGDTGAAGALSLAVLPAGTTTHVGRPLTLRAHADGSVSPVR